MVQTLVRIAALIAVAGTQGCTPTTPADGICGSPLVYGSDNRIEAFEVVSDSLWEFAYSSSVALMRSSSVRFEGETARVTAPAAGEDFNLCADERFGEQPSAAFCSGVLIDQDLVLTAGHCIKSESQCRRTRFVFDYLLLEDSGTAPPPLTIQAVFSCESIVARELNAATGTDFAIVRLDRPALGRVPATLSTNTRALRTELPVVAVGYGMGLPLKIDSGGKITNISQIQDNQIEVSTDTFVGNSGSPVLDASNQVLGILVRGQSDFDESCGCRRTRRVNNGGEDVMTVNVAVDALCAANWPSTLCGAAAACGDGRCTGAETAADCNEDCSGVSCGNGVCEGVELMTCPADCDVDEPSSSAEPPPEWTCQADFYGKLDGCDCGCGARDPDCDRPDQELYDYCPSGFACNAAMECARPGGAMATEWTCDTAFFDASDACDCECGMPDPDCENFMITLTRGCAENQVCGSAGMCETPMTDGPPTEWTCPASYYGMDVDCDCNCGAYDPDCDTIGVETFGCGDEGICASDGTCL